MFTIHFVTEVTVNIILIQGLETNLRLELVSIQDKSNLKVVKPVTNEIELVTLDRNLPITLNATKQNRNCNTKCIVNTFVFTTVSLKIYLQHLSGRSQTMIDACSQT